MAARAIISEARCLVRDRHLRSEFLRLTVGARHQRYPADTGRKTKIVLNTRRCAGLPAERAAIEDYDRETFRSGIDGGGQARRSGADHGDVVEALRIDRPHQAETSRQFVLTGIAQQLPTRTQHDRQLSRIDMEAFEQCFCRCVGFGIEQLVGVTVAAEKTSKSQYVAIFGSAENNRSAYSGF